MANTYTLINSTSLSTTAASVTFSAIPATFDDLVVLYSVRVDGANNTNNQVVTFNSDTNGNYSETMVQGDGSSASSSRLTNGTSLNLTSLNSGNSTSSTFSSHEIYIPKYTTTSVKPMSTFTATETNSATGIRIQANAQQYRGTSAISSITFTTSGLNFVSGSTFWLYGIKNS